MEEVGVSIESALSPEEEQARKEKDREIKRAVC
jgi:hypothetical protein